MSDAPRHPEILPADDPEALQRAGTILRGGGLVAFPTETVYGLGADATNEITVARIFEAKGRPRFNPLIAHCADLETAAMQGSFDDRARALAETFWPGPLTLVVPRRADASVAFLTSAGLDTLALRVPAHPQARALLAATGRPVAAPSANRSGAVSPTTAQHVAESLGDKVDLILDGGPCTIGVESTVVDLTGKVPVLLRPGGLPVEEIEARIGPLAERDASDASAPHSPGRLPSHYAPDRPLRLNAHEVRKDEALLAFGPDPLPGAQVALNLSATGDLREAAANLFAHLRALDSADVTGIAAMSVPEEGLGRAINDRLCRAAAPRS